MPPAPQWWDSTKTFQITSETTGTVVAGSSMATVEYWLFNDKGALLGATTMTGYRLYVEGWNGSSWVRSGVAVADQRWVQVAVTGIDNTGSGGMAAQSTGFQMIGGGSSLLISDIPANCGRKIAVQIIVPLGASESSGEWRVVLDAVTMLTPATYVPVLSASAGTFSSATVTTARYLLEGKMLTVMLHLQSCSVSASPNNLTISIPNGYIPAVTSTGVFHYSDNGTTGVGMWNPVASGVIRLFKNVNAAGNWTTSVGGSQFSINARFEVQ